MQSEPTTGLDADQSAAASDTETPVSVATVDEGAFMNLTSAIQSIHLHIWVTVPNTGTLRMESISLNDERALVHGAGRMFFQGASEDATKQIRQAQAGFNRKKSEWERRVRQSEGDSARRRAMRELQEKKGKHNPIGTRISPAENQFRRLVEALDLHITLERKREFAERQASVQASTPQDVTLQQPALPPGFVAALDEATANQKQLVVKEFFEIEAEVAVDIKHVEENKKSITFTPPLPKNRLYYVVDKARVIRLRRVKIANDVHYHNFESGQNEVMTLQSLINSVQKGGLWLLQPRSAPAESISDS